MSARILQASEIDGEFVVVVHLDTARVVPPQGAEPESTQERWPDPAWCFRGVYPLAAAPTRALADALLAAREALKQKLRETGLPIPHPAEGRVVDLLALEDPAPESGGDQRALAARSDHGG